jgi:hypothetical protein
MSISHNLDIQTTLSLEEIKELLIKSNLGLTAIDNFNGLDGFGITVFYTLAGDYGKKVIQEDYGFLPDVSIGFRLARNESETAGTETTAKALAILLLQGSGDAVFFINSDYIVLKRLNNKLTVYKEISGWLIPELDKSGIKYELETSEYAEEFA